MYMYHNMLLSLRWFSVPQIAHQDQENRHDLAYYITWYMDNMIILVLCIVDCDAFGVGSII
jgi:hypothetical protein